MSLVLSKNSDDSQPEPAAQRTRLSWVDLALLVVVLGSLVALLKLGLDLERSVAIVGIAGIVSGEVRRRFTQS
ncbi:DUF202 domain-containing protein [Streptomyces noursei]